MKIVSLHNSSNRSIVICDSHLLCTYGPVNRPVVPYIRVWSRERFLFTISSALSILLHVYKYSANVMYTSEHLIAVGFRFITFRVVLPTEFSEKEDSVRWDLERSIQLLCQ